MKELLRCPGLEFCVVGSRVFREMRVTNSAFACGVFLAVWCVLGVLVVRLRRGGLTDGVKRFSLFQFASHDRGNLDLFRIPP